MRSVLVDGLKAWKSRVEILLELDHDHREKGTMGDVLDQELEIQIKKRVDLIENISSEIKKQEKKIEAFGITDCA
ncbi:MAG: hypothetical protein V3R52_07510 [Candidatus Neomarinimicrobiota bacterium]